MDTIDLAQQPAQDRPHATKRLSISSIVTALAVLAATLVPVTGAAAAGFELDENTLVQVEGTLLVLSGQETAEQHWQHDGEFVEMTTLHPETVLLVTDDDDWIPLDGGLPENVNTGDTFSGTLSVPAESISEISDSIAEAIVGETPQGVIAADSVVGQEVIKTSEILEIPLVVEESTITPETSAVVSATGHDVDIVIVTLPTNPDAATPSSHDLWTMTLRLSDYWAAQSGEQISFIYNRSVQRVVSSNACNASAMWSEVAASYGAETSKWWMSKTDHLLVIAPPECSGTAGLGSLGRSIGGGLTYAVNSSALDHIVAHELGHNFSLQHSNVMNCAEADGCNDQEYGDRYDVMGAALRGSNQLPALNVAHKKRLDSLGVDLVSVALPAGVTGATNTFTLNAASATLGVRGLEITDPSNGAVYYVEYRNGTGTDAGAYYMNPSTVGLGAGLRVLRVRDDKASAVLTVPDQEYREYRSQSLVPGQSLISVGGGASIFFKSNGATAEVAVVLGDAPKYMAPSTPTLSGTLASGNVLTATTGAWVPSNAALTYEWLRNGAVISVATASTYKLVTADVGTKISARVTGTSSGFITTPATSAATAAIAPAPLPLTTAAPTITGNAVESQMLTANPKAWGPAPVSFTYEWKRNGVVIENSSHQNYWLEATDVGATLTVTVTGSKANYTTASRTSAATGVVAAATQYLTIGSPTISGTLVEGGLLTANTGTWGPAPVALSYQWQRSSENIPGAAGKTYTLTAEDVDRDIRVIVTGVKAGYYPASEYSASSRAGLAMSLTTAAPTITGTVKVGSRLYVNAGAWAPAPVTLSYQWLRDGAAISGATGTSYAPTSADISRRISVKVTGSRTGYTTVSRWSASTTAVPLAVQRFAGGDRYSTAIAMSATFDPGVGVLYVARGSDYPDALSAAPAAAAAGGPLLLVTATELPTAVKTEIQRLKPKKIIVVGSTGSINAAVYSQLAKLTPSITRRGGVDRYQSSRIIVDKAFGASGVDRVYLATGRNFPDALSASAAAGANNGAVILVDGLAGKLDSETIALIRKLNPKDIVLAGGASVLFTGIESSAKALKLTGGVLRLSGTDRFSTSLALNNNGFATASTVYIATGYNFPDALAGAPLAGASGSPLYVVPGTCVPKGMLDAIKKYGATKMVILGGGSTVSAGVEKLIPC